MNNDYCLRKLIRDLDFIIAKNVTIAICIRNSSWDECILSNCNKFFSMKRYEFFVT